MKRANAKLRLKFSNCVVNVLSCNHYASQTLPSLMRFKVVPPTASFGAVRKRQKGSKEKPFMAGDILRVTHCLTLIYLYDTFKKLKGKKFN